MSTKKRISLLFLFLALFSFLLVSQAAALEYIPDSYTKYYFNTFEDYSANVVSSSMNYTYGDGIASSDVLDPSSWKHTYSSSAGSSVLYNNSIYNTLLDSNVDGSQLNGGNVNVQIVFDIASGFDFAVYENNGTITQIYFPYSLYIADGSNGYKSCYNVKFWINPTGGASQADWYLISSVAETKPYVMYNEEVLNCSLPITSTPLFRLEFSFSGSITSSFSPTLVGYYQYSYIEVERGYFRENVRNYLDEYLNVFGDVNFPDPPDLSYLSLNDINFDFLNRFLINDQNTFIFDSSGNNYFQIFLTAAVLCLSIGLLSFTLFGVKR